VRIALNLKGLDYLALPVHLRRGEQHEPEYRRLNPQARVPVLADGDAVLTQSLAIVEYLEEVRPEPPLLPPDPAARARARALAQIIGCDIQPLQNLMVLNYLSGELGHDQDDIGGWCRHWIERGLGDFEASIAGHPMTGEYCHGAAPGLADIALVPQVYNARRFNCDLSACPTVLRIDSACRALPTFEAAAPENQPDAE
jgi:maleylpyruvate isomerase